jgi:hypothetical protein
MSLKSIKNLTVITAAIVLSACSAQVSRYHSSADNVNALRNITTKLDVGEITATKPTKSVMCRLANPVIMPNDGTINEYIENAFTEELKMAGLYDKNASIIISGNLNNTTASSGMSDGHWTFDMTVKSSNGKSFNIIHKHEYSGSFIGGVACRENMPDEFEPAVEELINAIIIDPRFKGLFS